MVRKLYCAAALLIALPVLIVPAQWGQAAEAAAEKVYVVGPGDTLSGIAVKLFGDAGRWKELLEANPQVTDAALIYPGDTLALPGQESETIAVSSGEEIDFAGEPYPPLPVETLSPEDFGLETAAAEEPAEPAEQPPVIEQSIYQATGHIAETLPELSIVSSVDSKMSLVDGDEVFISTPVAKGTAFTVVRPTQEVFHPVTGEFMGWVLKVMGWATVNCPGERAARAVITDALSSINVGDLLIPFDPDDVLEENVIGKRLTTFCPEKGRQGYLLASQETRVIVAGTDIVFIDQGKNEGVKQGDQFIVYRPLDPEGFHVIGQLQVLRVSDRTSAAIVIHSIRELTVSDPLQPWEPPATEEVAYGG
ncbi:LysM peptidoglycan-binding domain-containing protein [bacterium]|nr:LysM peptidoglycan-binding domain-containing protein [bacterium]